MSRSTHPTSLAGTRRRPVSLAVLSLVGVLTGACSDTPTGVTSGGEAELEKGRMAVSAAGQERQIEALVTAAEAAWAAHDASAYAALFAEDIDFISPLGTYLFGRDAVRSQHVLLFGGPFAGSVLDMQTRRIRFLTGTIAVVDVTYDLTGYQFLPPGLIATEPGLLQTLVRWVVVKRGGEWLIVDHQITQVLPNA